MKETIYTIPVSEAYSVDCECPLCELEKKLEKEAVEYCLGAAMMEPDFRITSNEKGYCRRHFTQMFESGSKLPLALVLDTHMGESINKLDKLKGKAASLTSEKKGLFKKSNAAEVANEVVDILTQLTNSCVICDKMSYTMSRYIIVLMDMYFEHSDFREKFDNSKGLCLKHFSLLADSAKKYLKGHQLNEFISKLVNKELSELSRIHDDIHKFTLKFDYRNKDMEWGTAKDAPLRAIEKLEGYIHTYEDASSNDSN